MNIWMAYIKQIYRAFIQVSGLKLWSLGDCNIVLFCFGAAPLSKNAQLQSPRAHSFNQNLSWPYIFVYYLSKNITKIVLKIVMIMIKIIAVFITKIVIILV